MELKHVLGNASMAINSAVYQLEKEHLPIPEVVYAIITELAKINAALVTECNEDRSRQCWRCLNKWLELRRELLNPEYLTRESIREILNDYSFG